MTGRDPEVAAKAACELRLIRVATPQSDLGDRESWIAKQLGRALETTAAPELAGRRMIEAFEHSYQMIRMDANLGGDVRKK